MHGRAKEKHGSNKNWFNWEFVWYRYLEAILQNLENVSISTATSWYDLPTIFDFRFLIMHGEDTKRYMRFPWYSVERMEKAYNEMCQAVGSPFDYMMFGHKKIVSVV